MDVLHHNRDRIYRIVDAGDDTAFTNPLLAGELKSAFPEIEEVTRVRHNGNGFYKYNNSVVDIPYDMCFDSTVFKMFDFKLIAGSEKEALQNPFSIVLTKSISRKIFGDKDPFGQVLRYNNLCNFAITGIIGDLPSNSTFIVDAILPFQVLIAFVITTPIAYYIMDKWLESFAYKTTLSWWIFALVGVLALGVALLTVSWQCWRAATRNPVGALRYE